MTLERDQLSEGVNAQAEGQGSSTGALEVQEILELLKEGFTEDVSLGLLQHGAGPLPANERGGAEATLPEPCFLLLEGVLCAQNGKTCSLQKPVVAGALSRMAASLLDSRNRQAGSLSFTAKALRVSAIIVDVSDLFRSFAASGFPNDVTCARVCVWE